MGTLTWIQILHDTVRISHRVNTFDKGMNPTILLPAEVLSFKKFYWGGLSFKKFYGGGAF